MSEPEVSLEQSATPVDGARRSAGALLRQAREDIGMHIGALAVALKVPVRKLEALEADRLQGSADVVFVRALAASVCRVLKVDAAPVLEQLPKATARALLPPESGPAMESRPPMASHARSLWLAPSAVVALLLRHPRRVLMVLLLGLVVLTGIVVVVFGGLALPGGGEHPPQPDPARYAQPPGVAPSTSLTISSLRPDSAVVPVSASESPSALQEVGQLAPPHGVGGQVVFRARGPSWVEVTDARGVVQIRKTLIVGDVLSASGVPPLSVVVGRADVTDVEVGGRAFDLTPFVRDQVARFEVR